MKKILVLPALFLLGCLTTNAQTAIGKQIADGASVLDFASGTTNGIILPAIETLPASPANGTFLLDKNDKKIKMYQNGAWVNLSDTGNTNSIVGYSGTVDTGQKTIMGAESSTADGILVLESTSKALVLPKIANPHLTVKSPYPGMMCYDTVGKALAVFDGNVWNYWK